MRLRHLLLLALITSPVLADDLLPAPPPAADPDVVSISRDTFVHLLQDNLAMRARASDLANQLEQAVKDRAACVEARTT